MGNIKPFNTHAISLTPWPPLHKWRRGIVSNSQPYSSGRNFWNKLAAKVFFLTLLVFILHFLSYKIIWAEDVLVPRNSLDDHTVLWVYDKDKEAESVFQNPAVLGKIETPQFFITGTQNFFGYDTLSSAYALPLDFLKLGLGYYFKGANDIFLTTKQSGEQPEISSSSIAHNFQSFYGTLSLPLGPNLWAGYKLQYFTQVLYTSSVKSLINDLGLYWQPALFLGLGIYTQNLLSTAYTWSTGTQENLTRKYVLESWLDLKPIKIMMNTDGANYLLGSELSYPQYLDIFGQILSEANLNIKSYALGVSLNLDLFAIRYTYLSQLVNPVQVNQHVLGFSLLAK
jgi:hypothetical protein